MKKIEHVSELGMSIMIWHKLLRKWIPHPIRVWIGFGVIALLIGCATTSQVSTESLPDRQSVVLLANLPFYIDIESTTFSKFPEIDQVRLREKAKGALRDGGLSYINRVDGIGAYNSVRCDYPSDEARWWAQVVVDGKRLPDSKSISLKCTVTSYPEGRIIYESVGTSDNYIIGEKAGALIILPPVMMASTIRAANYTVTHGDDGLAFRSALAGLGKQVAWARSRQVVVPVEVIGTSIINDKFTDAHHYELALKNAQNLAVNQGVITIEREITHTRVTGKDGRHDEFYQRIVSEGRALLLPVYQIEDLGRMDGRYAIRLIGKVAVAD